jgi:hypothetical protein
MLLKILRLNSTLPLLSYWNLIIHGAYKITVLLRTKGLWQTYLTVGTGYYTQEPEPVTTILMSVEFLYCVRLSKSVKYILITM